MSIGQGATLPLVALSARDLGASVGVAAFVVALIGIGQLLGDLPAGALAARIGEQKALVAACAVDALALTGAFLARSLWLLALAIFVTGLAGAVFSLARQAYLTETVPVRMRARALSTLGGTFRVGLFVGPFVGAALVAGQRDRDRVRLRRRDEPGGGGADRVPARRHADPAQRAGGDRAWRTSPCCPCCGRTGTPC